MNRTANRTVRRQRRKREHAPRPAAPKPTSDRAVYIGIGIAGFFGIILGSLIVGIPYWHFVTIAYLALVAYMINISAFNAYRGKDLSNLGASLARIPLRFVGYGTKEGKPLEAAHDHAETRKAVTVSVLVSLALLALITVLLVPGIVRR